jgi:dihydroorotase
MSERFDLVLAGGAVVTPAGTTIADIGIREGRIAAVGSLAHRDAAQRFDARGLHILPGVIDTHVHFREPGLEHKEDMESGSLAAVLGGVTAVFEMPNTAPATTDRATLDDKLARAETSMHCDYAFYVGATVRNAATLGGFESMPGVAGVKLFMGSSTGDLLVDSDDAILATLRSGTRRVAVHSEDEARLKARYRLALPGQPATHPVWRDAETARLSTERIIALARQTSRRIHILHMTTEEEVPLMEAARDIATCEVTPQHLTLTAPDCYERLGTRAQMNPPIREVRHRDALWRALSAGLVDCLASDHAPHTLAEKSGLYPQTPSGMPGVQTLVTVMLDHVNAGRLTLQRFAELTSSAPARVFGIAGKGAIAGGYDADLTVVDLGARRRIENGWIASRCGWTPYDGMTTTGWPVVTLIRGRFAMRDGQAAGEPAGRPLRFSALSTTAA